MPHDDFKKRGGPKFGSQKELPLPVGSSWFLGIGINNYKEFNNLNNAVKDVEDICLLLKEHYDLDSDKCFTLFNEKATRIKIIEKIEWLKNRVKINDKVLLYYSGHGHLDEDEIGFWVAHDASKNHHASHIRNSTIQDLIRHIRARHILLISDSCFSGTLLVKGPNRNISDAFDKLEQDKSRWVICSGRHDEQVNDGSPGENSPFCKGILKILMENKEPKLNVKAFSDMLEKLLIPNNVQKPEGAVMFNVGDEGGQYVFCRKLDELRIWEEICNEKIILPFYEFWEKFPQSRFAGEALNAIKEIEAWEEAKASKSLYYYMIYKGDYPQGRFIELCEQLIQNRVDKERRDITVNKDFERIIPEARDD